MKGGGFNKFVGWSVMCFCGFVVAVFITQFGDPATETAHQFQVWASRAILVAAPIIWMLGCVHILRGKKS